MRHCFFCGAELGFLAASEYDALDTCGARECERAARDERQRERDEAHDELDRQMGWD